nr:recombinase family protein [Mycolicibacterium sp. CR10]
MLGYARISTSDQTVRSQVDALQRAGCERIWTNTASGARADRPALEELLTDMRSGETLMVTRPDRLGRSLPHLLDLWSRWFSRMSGLCLLAEQIDTTSASLSLSCLVRDTSDTIAPSSSGLGQPGRHRRELAGVT